MKITFSVVCSLVLVAFMLRFFNNSRALQSYDIEDHVPHVVVDHKDDIWLKNAHQIRIGKYLIVFPKAEKKASLVIYTENQNNFPALRLEDSDNNMSPDVISIIGKSEQLVAVTNNEEGLFTSLSFANPKKTDFIYTDYNLDGDYDLKVSEKNQNEIYVNDDGWVNADYQDGRMVIKRNNQTYEVRLIDGSLRVK